MSNDEDLQTLFREISKAKKERFTGKMTISICMNQGGVGQMSLMSERNLKNSSKIPKM